MAKFHELVRKYSSRLGIEAVRYSDVDPFSYEIYLKDQVVVSQLCKDDVQLVKALLVLRLSKPDARRNLPHWAKHAVASKHA